MFTRASAAMGANWSLHDLRHSAAYRMASDPAMPLTDLQWVMGHAHLSTTQRYLNPLPGDVIEAVLAFHARQRRRGPPRGRRRSTGPRACRSCSARTRCDRGSARCRRAVWCLSWPGPASRCRPAGTGAELLTQFPPRPAALSWPATLAARQQVLARLLAPPFALD